MSRSWLMAGDCRDIMSLVLGENEVQTVVTSPPYFGLRDYGIAEQIGRDFIGCDLNPEYVAIAQARIDA